MSDVSDSNNTSAMESLEDTENEYEFDEDFESPTSDIDDNNTVSRRNRPINAEDDEDPRYCAAGGGGLVKKRKSPSPPDYGPPVKAGPSGKKVNFEAPTSDTDDNDIASRRNRDINAEGYNNMDMENLKNTLSVFTILFIPIYL